MSNNVHEHACRCCQEGLCVRECECYWFNAPHHPTTELLELRVKMATLRMNLAELGERLNELEKATKLS